jgi:hypothetical protein
MGGMAIAQGMDKGGMAIATATATGTARSGAIDRGTAGLSAAGTRAVASALGVMVGVSGLDHGFFEILQGNTPTPGLIVQAIGPDQRMWLHGTEEAFTIVPNFLLSGILAMAVGLLILVWSIGFIDRPRGSLVFLGLSGVLFLIGGGIGMLVFVLLGWAVARRLDRPVTFGRRLPGAIGSPLARAWRAFVVAGLVLYAFALEVAIAGVVPGVSDPELALNICWGSLLLGLACMGLTLAGSSAGEAAAAERPTTHEGAEAA